MSPAHLLFKMAQENTVSFKVFLHGKDPNDKPEVRRFGIDRDVVSNFAYLSEKLQTVFPSLRSKLFDVSWKDVDGDDVLISTDDELMIALTEMPGDVRKLFVTIKGDNVKEESPKRPGKSHPGVVCDECESGVTGFRYKCLECSNFDLCADCESKSLHPDHFMIRLPVPVMWRPHFGKRLAHHLSKSSRRCSSSCPAEDGSGPCGEAEACSCTRGHGHGHGGRAHGHHRGGPAVGLLDVLGTLVGGWINDGDPLGRNGNRTAETTKEPENATANGQTQTQNPETGSPKTQDGAAPAAAATAAAGSNAAPPEDEKMQYLQDVGKAVANFLDPFGIDVDVIVEKSKPAEKSPETKTEDKAKKNVSFADETANETKNEQGEIKKESFNSETPSERESPEKDGWTVVSGSEASNQESSVSATASVTKETAAPSATAPKLEEGSAPNPAATNASASTGAVPKSQGGFPVFYPPPPSFTNIPPFPPFTPPVPPSQIPWQMPPTPAPFHMMFPPTGGFQQQQPPKMQQQQQQQQQQQRPMPTQQQQQQPPPPAQQKIVHPDPKISQSVEAMMSMGFSNEGGWLTQLVEMKNGDIDKVLDLLQPVKRN